jgi:hypothetical protein
MEALCHMTISIARDYTPRPGPRFRKQGPKSGEEFRESILEPKFKEAQAKGDKILVDLDGGYGYGTSFLEESFGGLARIHGIDSVQKTLDFKSEEEPYLIEDVKRYIRDCRGKDKK